jgi:hypothetical protein
VLLTREIILDCLRQRRGFPERKRSYRKWALAVNSYGCVDVGVGVRVGEALGVGVALHGFAVVQLEQFTY